jgi:hypothetical protein
MISFSGKRALRTITTISDLSAGGASFYVHIYPTTVSGTDYTIFADENKAGWRLFVRTGSLYFYHTGKDATNDFLCHCTTTAISANTHYQIAFSFGFGIDDTDFVCYINGVSQSITTDTSPTDTEAVTAHTLYVGGQSTTASTYPFVGYIGEWAYNTGIWSTTNMIYLTTSKLMRQPKLRGLAVGYWEMSEVPDNVSITSFTNLVPDGDVAYTWSTAAPGYAYIDADDANNIKASKSDDGELVEFSCQTTTITAGLRVTLVRLYIAAAQESTSRDLTCSIYMASAYQTYQDFGASGTGKEYHTLYFYAPAAGWYQTDVDNMKLALQAPATIGKDEEVQVYFTQLQVGIGYRILDYVLENNLVGDDAVGFANNYLQYV